MNILEFIIFGALIVYIIAIIVSYMGSSQIMGYEIQMGSLSIAKTYTGFAIRSEEIIESPYTGYINYYVREGERVSSRDTVYSIDESGKLASMISSSESGEDSYTDDDLSDLRTEVIQFDRSFDVKDFSSVYDFKYDIEGSIIKLANLSIYQSVETLNSSTLGEMVSLCSTGQSGYIVYSIDGYEGLTADNITAECFDQDSYEKTRINNNDLLEQGATVGKLITDENWSLVIQVDSDRAKELEEEEYVNVKFIKTQQTSWGKVTVHELSDGTYVELSFTNSCVSFCTDRYVDIEIEDDDEEGLKIPNSAIAQKEFFIIPAQYMTKGGSDGDDGVLMEKYNEEGNVEYVFVETTVYSSNDDEYYVDNTNLSVGDYICNPEDTSDKMAVSKSGTLTGVYNMNKGYADFKQITILAQNDEYAIVSSNTKYGLTVYDRIVLDASSVDTDEFIYN
jgi:hypothetical protein